MKREVEIVTMSFRQGTWASFRKLLLNEDHTASALENQNLRQSSETRLSV